MEMCECCYPPKESAKYLNPSIPSMAPKSFMLTDSDHSTVSVWSGIGSLYLALHVVLKNCLMICTPHRTDHMIPLWNNNPNNPIALQCKSTKILFCLLFVTSSLWPPPWTTSQITNNAEFWLILTAMLLVQSGIM